MANPGRRKRAETPHAEGAARLAGRLRQLRQRATKTQEEVAAVRKIETGVVTEPGYFTVLAIASAIGASISDLAELVASLLKVVHRGGRKTQALLAGRARTLVASAEGES
jgi:transcriptional regulator with XRE-family HTH domain